MTSWPSSTRRSRFCRVLWPEVKSSTLKDWRTSDCLSSRLETTRVSLESSSPRLLKFPTLEKRSTTCNSNCWLKDSRLKPCLRNLRTLWTLIDGEDWKELTQTPGKCSKRSKPFKRDWSRRPKRSLRRMSLFRRRKSCTLSLRTYWLDSQVQR